MPFADEFLLALTQERVQGDFPPFSLGRASKIDPYLRKLVAELGRWWLVEADFDHYGSGYASYVPVELGRKDKSDTVTVARNGQVTTDTTGLRLYVSRLAPYWFYGQGWWSRTYLDGKFKSGGRNFLEPGHHAALDPARWQADCERLEGIFARFGYRLLTAEELRQPAPASIRSIPSLLADPPYRVFDCFFYWMD